MTVTVELARVRGFILDDPVAGVLDNTEYPLGGIEFVDVTDKVRTVSTARGKNRDLDRYSAGTMQVQFNNQDRFFDPLSATEIDPIPRIPVRFSYNGTAQYYGIVDDWNLSYNPGGVSYASLTASDELTKLARTNVLESGTATPALSGARVTEVLDMFTVDWPADKRDIDTGDSQLCVDTYEGQNALEYLQLIETSEQGQLFIGKEGDLVFRSRTDSSPRSTGLVTFADDGTGIDYSQVLVNYGTELMVNRAIVTAPLTSGTAENELSQITYGVISEEFDVLCAPGPVVQNIADFTVAKYGQPEYRFESLVVNLDSQNYTENGTILTLEIGDVVLIKFTPNQIGDPIEQYAQIIGVNHEVTPDRHDVNFRLSSLAFTSLVLDDSEFGKLDKYTLGF
jgi:hypothetical protein